jgi:hypothetical protein
MVLSGNGKLTLDNVLDALYMHPSLRGKGVGYQLNDFSGRLTIINGLLEGPNPLLGLSGDNSSAHLFFLGIEHPDDYTVPTTTHATDPRIAIVNARAGVKPEPTTPATSDAVIRDGLAQTRAATSRTNAHTPPAKGVTDVKLTRVRTNMAVNAMEIRGQ